MNFQPKFFKTPVILFLINNKRFLATFLQVFLLIRAENLARTFTGTESLVLDFMITNDQPRMIFCFVIRRRCR